jgi:hypothetical protein
MFSRLFVLLLVVASILTGLVEKALAADAVVAGTASYVDTRYSLAVSGGGSYYPDEKVGIALVSFAAVFDYDRVWPHSAPEGLRFKVEASAGVATEPSPKFIGSLDMLATLYFAQKAGATFTPYVEAGIGGIYTDFKRPGQGARFNFHPILGAGLDFGDYFVAVRAQHLSNLRSNKYNKPLDYAVVQVGFYL